MSEITDDQLRDIANALPYFYECRRSHLARAALVAREEWRREQLRAEKAEARVAELEQHVCDECDGDGWRENAAQGRHPCVCVAEMEPFIQLWARVAELEATLASNPSCPTCRPTHTDLMVAPEDVPDYECPTCGGSGALAHGTRPCPDCAGG